MKWIVWQKTVSGDFIVKKLACFWKQTNFYFKRSLLNLDFIRLALFFLINPAFAALSSFL